MKVNNKVNNLFYPKNVQANHNTYVEQQGYHTKEQFLVFIFKRLEGSIILESSDITSLTGINKNIHTASELLAAILCYKLKFTGQKINKLFERKECQSEISLMLGDAVKMFCNTYLAHEQAIEKSSSAYRYKLWFDNITYFTLYIMGESKPYAFKNMLDVLSNDVKRAVEVRVNRLYAQVCSKYFFILIRQAVVLLLKNANNADERKVVELFILLSKQCADNIGIVQRNKLECINDENEIFLLIGVIAKESGGNNTYVSKEYISLFIKHLSTMIIYQLKCDLTNNLSDDTNINARLDKIWKDIGRSGLEQYFQVLHDQIVYMNINTRNAMNILKLLLSCIAMFKISTSKNVLNKINAVDLSKIKMLMDKYQKNLVNAMQLIFADPDTVIILINRIYFLDLNDIIRLIPSDVHQEFYALVKREISSLIPVINDYVWQQI